MLCWLAASCSLLHHDILVCLCVICILTCYVGVWRWDRGRWLSRELADVWFQLLLHLFTEEELGWQPAVLWAERRWPGHHQQQTGTGTFILPCTTVSVCLPALLWTFFFFWGTILSVSGNKQPGRAPREQDDDLMAQFCPVGHCYKCYSWKDRHSGFYICIYGHWKR